MLTRNSIYRTANPLHPSKERWWSHHLATAERGRSDQAGSGGHGAWCACGFDTASRGRCSVSAMTLSRSLAPPLGLLCQVSNQLDGEDRNRAEVFIVCYCY